MKHMKAFRLILILAAILLCLAAAQAAAETNERLLPLVSIETADPGEGTRFVTEPVKGNVSAAIATWTPGYIIPPEPYYVDCTVSYTETDGITSVDSMKAQVKVRGNWTTSYEKKPLRIKFEEKQSLGGLNEGKEFKNWLLLAEYKDLSMLRNKTAFALAREILEDDLYCSDCELVEVEINGRYWGVYLLAEQQEAAKGRVNVPEPKKEETGPYTGYLVEFDGYYMLEDSLQRFTIDYNNYAPLIPFDGTGKAAAFRPLCTEPVHQKDLVGYTIQSSIRSEEQHDAIRNFISNAYNIMYSAAYEDKALEMAPDFMSTVPSSKTPREAVEAVVDVQSLADMYILSEIVCDPDVYFSSFFMSTDLSGEGAGKLRFEAPWDFDSAMGNRYVIENGRGFHAANVVDDVDHQYHAINPWLTVLMQEEWFTDIIAGKWTDLYDRGVFSEIIEAVRSDSRKYEAAFTRNYERWSNMRDKSPLDYELNREAFACRSEAESAEQLARWLEKRIDFLNGVWHR
jgi:hypothetical protein